MATPAPTKPKAGAAPAASPPPAPQTKAEATEAQANGRSWGAFVDRWVRKFAGQKPDHTEAGFIAALVAALKFVGAKDWNTVDDMLEEFEHQMRTILRSPGGIYADFVARDRETKHPRILVLTDWGLREAVEGPISFQLHYKPDRVTPAPKEHRHG